MAALRAGNLDFSQCRGRVGRLAASRAPAVVNCPYRLASARRRFSLDKRGKPHMTTKLDSPLKREILINEKAYTLTIDAEGLKLVEKGRRNGQSVTWKSIVDGAVGESGQG